MKVSWKSHFRLIYLFFTRYFIPSAKRLWFSCVMLANFRPNPIKLFTFSDEPICFFQKVENLSGRHVLTFLLVVGRFEVETEILVYRLNHLKLAVALHDELHLLGVEITLLAIAQRHKRPGEKLLVVGADTHVDGARQLDADETAVAGWVGEDVVHVARGDEGGEAWKLHDVTSVRRLVFQRR